MRLIDADELTEMVWRERLDTRERIADLIARQPTIERTVKRGEVVTMIQFTVYGTPVGKGRPKFSTFNGHATAYTPAKTVNYENLIKLSYQQQCGDKPYGKDVPLRAEITAYFPMPKSISMKRKKMMLDGQIRHTKKCDADNLAKSILDALNGIAFYDDSQVCELSVSKLYSDNPRVIVRISEVICDG